MLQKFLAVLGLADMVVKYFVGKTSEAKDKAVLNRRRT